VTEDYLLHANIELDFGNLHYVHAGAENGKTVILLHGFPEFWFGWRNQIPVLAAAGYHVIAPDQRGYNLSAKPREIAAYNLDLLAGDVLHIMEHCKLENVCLVGHDWGAAVAWHFAAKFPERLEKLVILNVPHPQVRSSFARHSQKQLRKSWYILFFQIPWLPEFLLSLRDHRNAVRMLQASRAPGRFSAEEIEQYRRAWRQPGAWKATINWYRAALRRPAQPLADAHIHVPTLMIWGVKDVALSHEMAQPSIDLCDEGRLEFIPEATHWVQHDAPGKVNRLILDFLRNPGG
jgi:pimeloyl-ACP methyl ester carboxylesterase